DAQEAYDRREAELGDGPDGEPIMRELERRVVLSVLDRKWREHLYEMDYLQEGIGLRAMGQRDPLVEYQREGFDMFQTMMEGIKEESVRLLFNAEVQVNTPESIAAAQAAQAQAQAEAAKAAQAAPSQPAVAGGGGQGGRGAGGGRG
nr:preprotein translocase subunit SecA [Micromonospora sp. DSM 115978]